MNEKTIQALLKTTFPKSDKVEWTKAATGEIKKENPLENLSWITNDDISFLPIYDKKDIFELKYLNAFSLNPSQHGYQGVRSWINLPCVEVLDEVTANATALEHLANGADGILFNIQITAPDITKLLDKIEWAYCYIAFTGNLTSSFQESITLHLASHKSKQLQGVIWHNNTSIDLDLLKTLHDKNIQCVGVNIASSTPVNEIAYALKTAVNYVDELTNKGVDVATAIQSITFSISVSADLLPQIAKLKTLRMLWYQVTQAYEIKNYQPSDLHIHARIEPGVEEKFQPHGNLLKNTLSALASVLGGCDSLTVYTEDENNSTMSRVARNVSNILREESHLNKVADAVTGSFALETMIDALGQKAWEEFTSHNQKL
ncbi:MAG TPA: methylmalonyl-CoA mutase family protein [Cyclobacteriaceae bacterium]